jgi:hypothetical protein
MVNYKERDKVRYVDSTGRTDSPLCFIQLNNIYTCFRLSDRAVSLKNNKGVVQGGFFQWRFKKVPTELNNKIRIL